MTYEYTGGYKVDTIRSGKAQWVPPHELTLMTASEMMKALVAASLGASIKDANLELPVCEIMAYLMGPAAADAARKDFPALRDEEFSKLTEEDGQLKDRKTMAANRAWLTLLARASEKINKFSNGEQSKICVVRRVMHDRNGEKFTFCEEKEVPVFIAANPAPDEVV